MYRKISNLILIFYLMTTKLISITPNCEKIMVYCARVSNPKNQENENIKGLLKYCIKNGHWSIFEMGNMIVEINAPLFVITQILRHRSFSFQQFSQRYSDYHELDQTNINIEFRLKENSNRQSSEVLHPKNDHYLNEYKKIYKQIEILSECLKMSGVSNETIRQILPQHTMSRIYMNGSIRSFIHYLQARTDKHTQKEHRIIAEQIKKIFIQELPLISEILNFVENIE